MLHIDVTPCHQAKPSTTVGSVHNSVGYHETRYCWHPFYGLLTVLTVSACSESSVDSTPETSPTSQPSATPTPSETRPPPSPSPTPTPSACSQLQELCNHIDDNCNGQVDEGSEDSTVIWYPDEDHDGYGDQSRPCAAPGGGVGLISVGGDCDDANASLNPSIPEVCKDGIDNDCDGIQPTCGIWGYGKSDKADATYVTEYVQHDSIVYVDVSLKTDLNHDGKKDVVLGMYSQNVTTQSGELLEEAGTVFVAYSPAFGPQETKDLPDRIEGTLPDGHFGLRVDSGGDIDGDGLDELVVGTSQAGAPTPYFRPGGIFTYTTPLQGLMTQSDAQSQALGTQPDANLAVSVSLGDTNGNGIQEIAAGDSSYKVGDHTLGAVFLFESLPPGDSTTDAATAFVIGNGTYFGSTSSISGDLNGDGLDDLAIGSFDTDTAACDGGAVFIFFGPLLGEYWADEADVIILGDLNNGNFGWDLSVGDADGNGVDDLLVGAPTALGSCQANSGKGFAYLFYGPLTSNRMSSQADAIIEGENEGDILGFPVMLSSDFDADGRNELVMGVRRYTTDVYDNSNGRIYIFYRPLQGSISAATADAIIDASEEAEWLGMTLSSGDVNADGYDDLLTGTYSSFEKPARAYLFLGGPTPAP